MSESYKAAGVDVEAGYKAVRLMKQYVEKTVTNGVLSGIGGFGGLFELDVEKYKKPVLVSGTDGVGTKLKIAMLLQKHDTVGEDCVAMCVNDIVCSGAEPLIFLDYIAVGKNIPEKVAEIVKGVANGCVKAGCALVGGETAEMPGLYAPDEYDIAGFTVGAVEKGKIIDGSKVCAGDIIIGLRSSGIHSNGYSLVRKVFNINNSPEKLETYFESLGCTLGEELLKPTRIYVKQMLPLIEKFNIKAIAHITGGGFYENIPRMLPEGMRAKIIKSKLEIPPIFDIISNEGGISGSDMFGTFNMGVGMVFAAEENEVQEILSLLGPDAYVIGEIVKGKNGVDIC
jgi:phosphoribosylformylglycinamidine cyclo-ligase